MDDALILWIKSTLPSEICDVVEKQLLLLGQGKYEEIIKTCMRKIKDDTREAQSEVLEAKWSQQARNLIELYTGRHWKAEDGRSSELLARRYEVFILGLAALSAFQQSNCTGPPLSFDPFRTVISQGITEDDASRRSVAAHIVASLDSDGESAYRLTPNPELLSLASYAVESANAKHGIPAASWASLRVNFLRQRLLSERSPSLQKTIYRCLSEIEKELHALPERNGEPLIIEFLLERAAIHLHHGFDKKARNDIDEAAKMRGFQFALTGRLGKRTRYQERDLSQLVVLAHSKDGESSSKSGKGKQSDPRDDEHNAIKPEHLDLNDDTLLESISFAERPNATTSQDVKDSDSLSSTLTSLDPGDQPLLSPLDSIALLTLASSITNTSPADGLTREETLPYATRVLTGGSSNWQIYTQALLVRSRIEGYRSRTMERGLLQLQALVDQVIAETSPDTHASTADSTIAPQNDGAAKDTTFLPRAKQSESAPVQSRLRYIYALCSPFRWELEAELAARWVSVGGLRSALEIYERLEMWAEAALCWAATENEEKARRIVRKQLFHSAAGEGEDSAADADSEQWTGPPREPPPSEAPRLYCILGDIDKDPQMYEKAWEVSGNRYARAQRSLGRHWYTRKEFAKASSAYAKSLSVNKLNQQSWFALGCALLELERYEKASGAFSRVVQLDDTDAEAWSNLAAALLKKGPPDPKEVHGGGDATASEEQGAGADDNDESDPKKPDGQQRQHVRDALNALKRAAALKHDDYRIWDNLLTVAASTAPPAYADIISAQRRIIEMRGAADGERCVDAKILSLVIRELVLSLPFSSPQGSAARPGLQRMALELLDSKVVPLITANVELWTLVARVNEWRERPGSALESYEKAWRAATTAAAAAPSTVAEGEPRARWTTVADTTAELVEAYRRLGPQERSEGLSAGSGQPVAKDWRFKARSAIRGVLSKAKEDWEEDEKYKELEKLAEGLKGSEQQK